MACGNNGFSGLGTWSRRRATSGSMRGDSTSQVRLPACGLGPALHHTAAGASPAAGVITAAPTSAPAKSTVVESNRI